MGNEHAKCKGAKGYLAVQTLKPYYHGGEPLTGYIYLRVTQPLDAKHIEIKVEGKEKTCFTDREYHQNQEGGGEWVEVKRSQNKKIIDSHAIAFTFQATCPPGDYTIPFSFNLPPKLPSSLLIKKKEHAKKPKAKVKYTVKTILHGKHDHDDMKYKQTLLIREEFHSKGTEVKQKSENQITTWCCMNQGISAIESVFNKDSFEPHEKCEVKVEVDNSNCNVAMTSLRIAIEQDVELHADHHSYHETFTLISKDEGAIGAKSDKTSKHLSLNLGDLKFPAAHEKKKRGVTKAVSPEDQFLMASIQAACNGSLISNKYYLAIRTSYDGCTCCAKLPNTRIPINVIPAINPHAMLQAPSGWSGKEQAAVAMH